MRIRFWPRFGAPFFVTLLACFLILAFIAGVLLAEVTVHPGRNVQGPEDEMRVRRAAQRSHYELAEVAVAARDGAMLRGWSIRPANGNGNAVILLHGLGDNRTGMTGYAELLLSQGFSVLMPDARAHGVSGGDLATFGLLETDDIRRWLDWLQQNDHPACIFGLGESMGAAQLLQSLRSETRFCAVVAESPFASFREIGYDRVGQRFHTGAWLGRTILRPIVEFAFLYARAKYKLDFEQVSPEDAIARTRVPIFLIHGKVDSNIPVRHAELIVMRNPGVSLWEVPNADHCGARSTAPDEFRDRVLGWFASHETGQVRASAVPASPQKANAEYMKRRPLRVVRKGSPPNSAPFKILRGEKSTGYSPLVAYEIQESGEIANIHLTRSSGFSLLDNYALKGLLGMRYNARPGCGVLETEAAVIIDLGP
jgi:pimeloyl-ACP methyl ester carboxylesterase